MKKVMNVNAPERGRPGADYIDKELPQNDSWPAGPFRLGILAEHCSLLIFVPRNLTSLLVNAATGGYGYSHVAIDCGDIDIPSGKRVMVESTIGAGVHNSFQDEYGERKFVRIPLERTGIGVKEFCECVRSKLGEKFDEEDALTLGLLHNPARQICSDLVTVCLPETMRASIARHHQTGSLHFLSAVRVYSGPNNSALRLFVSPNGFAEYFGAPKGTKLSAPDQALEPVIRS